MIDTATTQDLQTQLETLQVEARAWFDPPATDHEAHCEAVVRRLCMSSLLDLTRPDQLNLVMVARIAQAPDAPSDAQLFAYWALATLQCAADELATGEAAEEAYALRYLTASRDALRLAELVVAPRVHQAAQTEAATAARAAAGFDKLRDVAAAWLARPDMKWPARVQEIARDLHLSEKRVEALHAEAVKLGLL